MECLFIGDNILRINKSSFLVVLNNIHVDQALKVENKKLEDLILNDILFKLQSPN